MSLRTGSIYAVVLTLSDSVATDDEVGGKRYREVATGGETLIILGSSPKLGSILTLWRNRKTTLTFNRWLETTCGFKSRQSRCIEDYSVISSRPVDGTV